MNGSVTLMLATVILTVMSFAPSEASPDVFGVYETLEAFSEAKVRMESGSPTPMSEEAKRQRRRAIAQVLDHIPSSNRQSLERAAQKHQLIIYAPNSDFSTMSDPSDLFQIEAPRRLCDSITYECGYNARFEWKDPKAIIEDASHQKGPVGGHDAAGLSFTNVTRTSDVTDRWLYTWDYRGDWHGRYENPTIVRDGTKYAAIFVGTDSLLGTDLNSGVYDWWKGSTWVWFRSGCCGANGDVHMTYAHNWDSTHLSSVSYSGGSSGSPNDVTLQTGLTYKFSLSRNKWAADGLAMRY